MATKKTRTIKRKQKTAGSKSRPPITGDAAKRLEKLAGELDAASREASELADVVRTDLAHELTKHLVDGNAKKKSD